MNAGNTILKIVLCATRCRAGYGYMGSKNLHMATLKTFFINNVVLAASKCDSYNVLIASSY